MFDFEVFDQDAVEDALPILGAAGIGLLALAGAGLGMRRRRRRSEEAEWIALRPSRAAQAPARPRSDEPAFSRPDSMPAEAAAPAASAATARADVPRTSLPEGFDLSRFGPHVRAAYLGPTPDNPSLSLKYRLRRAAAMDQRERLSELAVPKPAVAATRPAMPQWRSRTGSFMLRRAGTQDERQPALQK